MNQPPGKTGRDFAATRQSQVTKFIKAQDGLVVLADQTGGRFSQSTDLGRAISRMLEQQGYYLIGYRPDEATFKSASGGRPYHELQVTVRRQELRAHFRKGFCLGSGGYVLQVIVVDSVGKG